MPTAEYGYESKPLHLGLKCTIKKVQSSKKHYRTLQNSNKKVKKSKKHYKKVTRPREQQSCLYGKRTTPKTGSPFEEGAKMSECICESLKPTKSISHNSHLVKKRKRLSHGG